MDPQKLLLVDKRVVGSIRLLGLVLSLALALLCILIFKGYIVTQMRVFTGACLPLAGLFTALGIALAFWEPYTLKKVVFYTWGYVIVGVFLGTLVLGFSTFSFLSWMVLIATVGVYLQPKGALLTYIAMLVSLAAWIALQPSVQTFQQIALYVGDALAVGITIAIFMAIWQLTNKSIRSLETSQQKESFEHEQLTSLINSMADGVIAVDEQANVLLYNAAALNVLDLNSSMQGKSLGKFLSPLDKDNKTIDIVELVTTTKLPTINRDLRLKYSDDSIINLYLSIAPVHLGYGKRGSRGFVLMLRDITREKSLEEERDEFISVVSHELRTPIAISEGNVSNAQVIADRTGDMAQVKTALQEAHNQILFLSDMINDLATLSRAERGKLTLEIEPINVPGLVQELATNYAADAEKKGLTVTTKIDPGLTELHTGKLYVREVLQNFITNSIKYTEKGGVTIAARPHDKGVMFEVIDTGIGISKSDQERVFDKFFRSEDFRTRQSNGTGLGLYVTMKLARLLHADISLESELNKGSTFSIFVPDLQ